MFTRWFSEVVHDNVHDDTSASLHHSAMRSQSTHFVNFVVNYPVITIS
jgi:hypothetical protein